MMIIFAYLPYGLAEGISLSGKRQHQRVVTLAQQRVCRGSCFLLADRCFDAPVLPQEVLRLTKSRYSAQQGQGVEAHPPPHHTFKFSLGSEFCAICF